MELEGQLDWRKLLPNTVAYHDTDAFKQTFADYPALINQWSPTAYCTPLGWVLRHGLYPILHWTLLHGANVNVQSEIGKITPIHQAVKWRGEIFVLPLVAAGADVTAPDEDGRIALDRCIFYSGSTNTRVIRLLLWAGSPPPTMEERRVVVQPFFDKLNACKRVARLLVGLQRFRRVPFPRDVAHLLARAVWDSRMEWMELG